SSSPPARPAVSHGTGGPSACSARVASAPHLGQVPTALVTVAGEPFGVVTAASGHWAFVSVPNGSGGGSVDVYQTTSAVPGLVRTVPLPAPALPLGEALTPDGRYLLVASQGGAMVISVARAESGRPNSVVGLLTSPNGAEAIEVAVSPDGRYAFVSLESSFKIAVFRLHQALTRGFGPSDFAGLIPTGEAPVGLAFSPGGRWLYSTSELAGPASGGQGSLSVISVPRAETHPARSLVTTVNAGCDPVRVITSADGAVVWVTARGSDALLAFSAARLLSDPAQARLAEVQVGEAPVGLALVDGGRRLVAADSDRFSLRGAQANLAVVSVAAVLAGRPAVLGYIKSGRFPRQMALEPGGRILLVTNFASGQLEAVSLAGLP
ncbi:MAG: beta-propeller fold lactonase family protein, partial [Streptosporangiaceae bacterium]